MTSTSSSRPFRIACCWAGRPVFSRDNVRSLPYATFAPLFDIPGTQWAALFTGPQRDDAPPHPNCERPALPRVKDTLARLALVDLVVTVDTLLVHLAGTARVPTLLLLPYSPDWRWLRRRPDTVWYPTVTLVRQRALHDWDSVIERVYGEVQQRMAFQGTSQPVPCGVPPTSTPAYI